MTPNSDQKQGPSLADQARAEWKAAMGQPDPEKESLYL
jgi:hypothetical protein